MVYDEIFKRANLLNMIPVSDAEYDFPSSLATSIILLQVEYNGKIQEYEAIMQEVLKKLKKDGFDERYAQIARMKEIDNRIANGEDVPEELRQQAEETRKTEDDFNKEMKEVEEQYLDARRRKGQTDVPNFFPVLTKQEYEELVTTIGVKGDINVGLDRPIPKVTLLRAIAELLL